MQKVTASRIRIALLVSIAAPWLVLILTQCVMEGMKAR